MSALAISGKPLVLVVEDEAITRMAAVVMLCEAGYEAVEADSGPAAVLVLEERTGIRVMLTDIDMPAGLDGIKLAACVHRRWPGVGIIMTSGKVRPAPGDVPSGARFIAKPYAEASVLAEIGRIVAQ
ncbi:response regulator [Methylobacterium sp. NEAU 140]|uniref:response regulator n=1 Tax=Methylobacterium sp. NEAU 140 TaxID=3064945 RepID=UPI002735088B|nr:response regulator [Methylobacterium sp. NEAU 140]MDP4025508.1 response regulator [Methylobacterium sp. NEAU 140]